MPYTFAGQANMFPQLDQDIRILYVRNPRKLPLSRYALFADSKRQLTHYTVIDNNPAFRFPGGNKESAMWPDGTPRPDGRLNRISVKYEPIRLERHLHNAPHGAMGVANQTYDVISNQILLLAQRAGTLRTLWAYAQMQADITSNRITNAALNTLSGNPTDITAGTVTNPIFLRALVNASQVIHRQTGGVVNESHLKVVIPPVIAVKLAESAEMRDYVARSPSAMGVLHSGFSNNRYGLPLQYHGFEIVVEDTVVDTALPWATSVLGDVFSAKQVWILARQDGNMGSGMQGPDAEGDTYPTTFSTLAVFEGPYYTLNDAGGVEYRDGTYGMGSEIRVDKDNEIVEPAIRDNFGIVTPAALTGYVYTSAIP